jgi:hypothetical protein
LSCDYFEILFYFNILFEVFLSLFSLMFSHYHNRPCIVCIISYDVYNTHFRVLLSLFSLKSFPPVLDEGCVFLCLVWIMFVYINMYSLIFSPCFQFEMFFVLKYILVHWHICCALCNILFTNQGLSSSPLYIGCVSRIFVVTQFRCELDAASDICNQSECLLLKHVFYK